MAACTSRSRGHAARANPGPGARSSWPGARPWTPPATPPTAATSSCTSSPTSWTSRKASRPACRWPATRPRSREWVEVFQPPLRRTPAGGRGRPQLDPQRLRRHQPRRVLRRGHRDLLRAPRLAQGRHARPVRAIGPVLQPRSLALGLTRQVQAAGWRLKGRRFSRATGCLQPVIDDAVLPLPNAESLIPNPAFGSFLFSEPLTFFC